MPKYGHTIKVDQEVYDQLDRIRRYTVHRTFAEASRLVVGLPLEDAPSWYQVADWLEVSPDAHPDFYHKRLAALRDRDLAVVADWVEATYPEYLTSAAVEAHERGTVRCCGGWEPTMPETTLTKARRLPIRILQHDAAVTVADVTGDHGTYRITVVYGSDASVASVVCSCPAQVEACSHVLALALLVKKQR